MMTSLDWFSLKCKYFCARLEGYENACTLFYVSSPKKGFWFECFRPALISNYAGNENILLKRNYIYY